MKKAKSRKRPSAKRAGAAPGSVGEYFAGLEEPSLGTMTKMRAAIRSAVPREATETISYGIPAFKYGVVLVWFAAFSNHCSLFPTAAIIDAFKDELKGFSTSKGTIQFPTSKPLPATLIRKLVKARIAQVASGKRH